MNPNPLLKDSTTMDIEAFNAHRTAMNEKILASGHLGIQRFFNLDTRAYDEGALSAVTKELMGLVASLVLRCDDCVTYHVGQCIALGVTDEQFFEALNVGLVVGGSIVIPHLRRAVERIEEIRGSDATRH